MAVKMEQKFSCGCGFTTKDAVVACVHVELTGHTINKADVKIQKEK